MEPNPGGGNWRETSDEATDDLQRMLMAFKGLNPENEAKVTKLTQQVAIGAMTSDLDNYIINPNLIFDENTDLATRDVSI